MKTEILIVTFKRDFPYLRHCLRSIRKFASGFSGVTIVVPRGQSEECMQVACPETNGMPVTPIRPGDPEAFIKIVSGDEWPDNPMLWHEWVIMCGDVWCPDADIIVHIDADCIFTAPVTPETYAPDGKPILRWELFASVARREPGVLEWDRVTQRCLPYRPLVETMRCMPLVYHRDTYAIARRKIEETTAMDAGDYIRSCKSTFPQGFCEFVTLGNVAMREQVDRYIPMEQTGDRVRPDNHVIQFWSHGALNLKQTIWIKGVQQSVVPINIINEVLGPEGNTPVQPVTGERELPAILMEIDHRDNLGAWLNKHGFTGAGAEIGVMHGGWAETILKEWNGQRYYMVDLWARQSTEVYRERTDDIDYEAKYRDCVHIASRFPIVQIIRKASVEAAKDVPDGSLDWVFIDANHAYGAVLADMDAWFPKLRPGGVLAGHDYGHDTNYPHWCEVKPAVDRWMTERNIKFRVTGCSSWWSIKP